MNCAAKRGLVRGESDVGRAWDVIVVGCGPVGAYAANLLGRHGLDTLVIERAIEPYALPRAVHVDHEIVRLLADIGLVDTLLPLMRAGDGHLHVGADHGVIRYLSVAGQPRPYGYANDYFFYQPELEATLRDALAARPNVELRLGYELAGMRQDADLVTLTLADGTEISTRWVIGCDGARSTLRKAAGIQLDDLAFDEPWLVVDAEVEGPISFPELGRVPPDANLQNLSVMMCDPTRPATVVPGRGNHRRWEFMLLPGEADQEMAAPDVVAGLVAPWVRDVPHKIIRAATYRFHGLVAAHWRQGRVFLAGDSAHQTPPFFGQGMCHGMRDAANLAWKMALVASGKADARLLDTYQDERDAQVRHVISAAIDAGRYICELDMDKAHERDNRIRAQQGIRSASELIAPIASAIVSPRAGERFINPELLSGQLFDDATGGGWVLIEIEPAALGQDALDVLRTLGAKRFALGSDLADRDGHLAAWFTARQVTAALLRPDFYVGVVARDPTELAARLAALGTQMHLLPAAQNLEGRSCAS